MNDGTLRRAILAEVARWPGVVVDAATSENPQVRVGRIELGHLHGDAAAHLPFPRDIRSALLASGRVGPHPLFPESGWVERRMEGPDDVEDVIALFRMNYERASSRARRATAREEASHA